MCIEKLCINPCAITPRSGKIMRRNWPALRLCKVELGRQFVYHRDPCTAFVWKVPSRQEVSTLCVWCAQEDLYNDMVMEVSLHEPVHAYSQGPITPTTTTVKKKAAYLTLVEKKIKKPRGAEL